MNRQEKAHNWTLMSPNLSPFLWQKVNDKTKWIRK